MSHQILRMALLATISFASTIATSALAAEGVLMSGIESAFLQSDSPAWKRALLSYSSEETDMARFEVAYECNAEKKQVFLDYISLRLIGKSADNPDGLPGVLYEHELPEFGEDWIQWNGVAKLKVGEPGKVLKAPYLMQKYKIFRDKPEVDSHFFKLNPGPMRARKVEVASGSKKLIASWIAGEVGKVSAGTSISISATRPSGLPFSTSFNLSTLPGDLEKSLGQVCK